MRTHIRIAPGTDFEQLLRFLNAPVPRELILSDLGMRLLITHASMPRGSFEHRFAAASAIWRFGRAVVIREPKYLGYQILGNFVKVMEDRGLDYSRSMWAWSELWRFLKTELPEVHGRIVQCRWCARFMYRYTRRTQYCSPLCRLARKLIRHPDPDTVKLSKPLLQYWPKIIERNPRLPVLTRVSKIVTAHFLGPIYHQQ
jgi:hypothetical protein